MDDEELERFTSLFETFVNSLSVLTSNFVFVNAIYRNINSGENTVAWHQTPYNQTLDLFGITLTSPETRYNGYGKVK